PGRSAGLVRTEGSARPPAEAYLIRQSLTLSNNFTYFLDDPVNGDQFSQFDRRTVTGGNISHTIKGKLGSFDTESMFGIQLRRDDIAVGLLKTVQRTTLSTVSDDRVEEASAGVYAQNTTRWTEWLRTVAGVRGDYFRDHVTSDTP